MPRQAIPLSGLFLCRKEIMIKLRSTSEMRNMEHLHDDIFYEVKRTTGILDMCYNCDGIDGGYVVIAENEEDLWRIKEECVDYTTEPIEQIIRHGCCVNVLFLPATEYSVSIIMHDSIEPSIFKEWEAQNG